MLTIVGMSSSLYGCSCVFHDVCGDNVDFDTVIRFTKKIVEVEESVGNRKRRFEPQEIVAAVWLTDGEERCIVGRLPSKYDHLSEELEGRCAQVVDLFAFSPSRSKRLHSYQNQGSGYARLIDKGSERSHSMIDSLLSDVESDPEETEET